MILRHRHRQSEWPAQSGPQPHSDRPRLPDARKPLGQGTECLGQLQASKRRAEAVVDAAGEGEVLGGGLTGDVKAIGCRVDVRVTVGRRQECDHPLVPRHDHIAHLGWLIGYPRRLLDRRIKAKQLLDNSRRPPRFCDEQLPLLSIGKQPAHAAPPE